jgi:hypothetical protein
MKNKKTIGIVLMVAGVVLLIGSLVADLLGIGNAPGFGLYQVIGSAVGVVVAAAGLVLFLRK